MFLKIEYWNSAVNVRNRGKPAVHLHWHSATINGLGIDIQNVSNRIARFNTNMEPIRS
jgi:hypothetical protein